MFAYPVFLQGIWINIYGDHWVKVKVTELTGAKTDEI